MAQRIFFCSCLHCSNRSKTSGSHLLRWADPGWRFNTKANKLLKNYYACRYGVKNMWFLVSRYLRKN